MDRHDHGLVDRTYRHQLALARTTAIRDIGVELAKRIGYPAFAIAAIFGGTTITINFPWW